MSDLPSTTKSRKYKIRRWMLFATNLIGVISTIIISVLGVHGIGPSKYKERTVLITVSVVSITINLLGMAGALLEHVYLLYTYSVISVIIGLVEIVVVVQGNASSWFSIIQHLLTGYQAYSFAQKIKRLRIARNELNNNMYAINHAYDEHGIISAEQEPSVQIISVSGLSNIEAPVQQTRANQNNFQGYYPDKLQGTN